MKLTQINPVPFKLDPSISMVSLAGQGIYESLDMALNAQLTHSQKEHDAEIEMARKEVAQEIIGELDMAITHSISSVPSPSLFTPENRMSLKPFVELKQSLKKKYR